MSGTRQVVATSALIIGVYLLAVTAGEQRAAAGTLFGCILIGLAVAIIADTTRGGRQ